jgi:hypothetical protein
LFRISAESGPADTAIATIIARYAPTPEDRAHLRRVAEAIVVDGRKFYDALVDMGVGSDSQRL